MTISPPDPRLDTLEVGDVAVPRPEYPRPDRDRSAQWLCLNGRWDLDTDGAATAPVTVPFAWESAASGIGRTWLERGTYRRTLTVPASWGGLRTVLCFGAVHHRAVVRIDGSVIGEHVGGHESFEFDVTDHVLPGVPSELVVEVEAPADKRSIPHGKQRSIPRDDYDGVAFTPTSGIWQTVWVEARGRTYAREVALRGDDLTAIDVSVRALGDRPSGSRVRARLLDEVGSAPAVPVETTTDTDGTASLRIDVPEPRLWSPDDPYLYRVEVTVGDGDTADVVVTTTGLRRIETSGEHLLLNGERLFLRGVLDQGYWPDTGLTAPDAESLRRDLELALGLGYNTVRKHLKFEEPLWLHEADRLGVLVWAEPPCPSRFSAEAARGFEAQLPAMVERDGNHPSIVVWGLYNEEWGLDWDIPGSAARTEAAIHAYEALAALDRTRPIVENSGWAHVRSDLVDWHYYEPDLATWGRMTAELADGTRTDFPVRLGPEFVVDKSLYASDAFPRTGVPILNSEYGEGFTSLERAWHLRWETQELRRHDRFAGYVWTEFADVEHESAGLLTADRRTKDGGGCVPSDVNAETVIVLDLVPLAAGADIEPPQLATSVTARVSHHGRAPLRVRLHAAWTTAGAPVTGRLEPATTTDRLDVAPFVLSEAVEVVVPPAPGPARLVVWATDETGRRVARCHLDAAAVEAPNRRGARPGQPLTH